MGRVSLAVQAIDGAQQIALVGATTDQGSRTLVFTGLGAVFLGTSVLVAGFTTAAKVALVGGVMMMAGGFLRGFKQGMEEAIREAEKLSGYQVIVPDTILVPNR